MAVNDTQKEEAMYAYLTRIAGKTAFALVLVLLAAGATAAAPKTAYDIPF